MSAGKGAFHWRVQRITALLLIPLTLWFVFSLLAMPDMTYGTIKAWMAMPWHAALLGLLVVNLCWHSQLGVQVVIEDYVHGAALSSATLRLSTLLHMALAGVGLFAIVRVAFAATAISQGSN